MRSRRDDAVDGDTGMNGGPGAVDGEGLCSRTGGGAGQERAFLPEALPPAEACRLQALSSRGHAL